MSRAAAGAAATGSQRRRIKFAVWSNIEAGAHAFSPTNLLPVITIDDSIYPTAPGVQFWWEGVVDERNPVSRPNGFDATGPQESSTYHMFPDLFLDFGDELEARWVDVGGIEHINAVTVESAPQPPPFAGSSAVTLDDAVCEAFSSLPTFTGSSAVTLDDVDGYGASPAAGFNFPGDWDGTPQRPEAGMALEHLDFSTFVSPDILTDVGPTTMPTVTMLSSNPLLVSGECRPTADSQVIEDYIINANFATNGYDNITVRNCVINFNHTYGIDGRDLGRGTGTGLTVENCIIDGTNAPPEAKAFLSYVGVTVTNCWFRNYGGAPVITGTGHVWTDNISYCTRTWSGAHKEALFCNSGYGNTLLRNVFISEGGGTSTAVALYNDLGAFDDWTVEDNLFAASGGYLLYAACCPYKTAAFQGTNMTIRRNRFSTLYFPTGGRVGPFTCWDGGRTGNVWGGTSNENVWHDGPNAGNTVG